MAKLILDLDIPESIDPKKDFYDKDGKLLHMAHIPEKLNELKKLLKLDMTITPKTKQILFVVTRTVVQTLNESGFSRWLPNILKTIIVPMIVMQLLNNKDLIKLLESK